LIIYEFCNLSRDSCQTDSPGGKEEKITAHGRAGKHGKEEEKKLPTKHTKKHEKKMKAWLTDPCQP